MPVWTHEKQRSFLLIPNAYLCGSFYLTQQGCSVSLAPVTPRLFRTAPGFVLVPSDPVEVGSLQNVPGTGSRGMSAALPPPALTDWHFWFGAEPGEWREGFDSWEIFCLTDLEDSCAKKETLPCRNAESQPVFFSTDCLSQLCFTELHSALMTNNKSNRLKNLCGLHPAALSFSHGPRGFLAFVKKPFCPWEYTSSSGRLQVPSLDELTSQHLLSTDDMASTILCWLYEGQGKIFFFHVFNPLDSDYLALK